MTNFRLMKKAPCIALEVDFPVGPGITAIYGPAGAGKSLLLQLAAGLLPPDSGRVLFDDAILYDGKAGVHVPACRRGFGYLPQSDSLFPHLTLAENLRFAAQRFPRLERHRRVADWLERCQISACAEMYPRQLSARQKLAGALARMLVGDPKLLLLDDCGLSEGLLQEIRALTPVPVLFATRDLELCCAAASQMLLLDSGRILQAGAPRAILDRPAGIDAARLVGIPNLFEGRLASLDPFRNSSLIEFEHFSLSAAYVPAHFKGDRVWVAIRAGDLKVHASSVGANCLSVPLVRTSFRTQSVRLEFAYQIFADLTLGEYAGQKDNKDWYVEFPPAALQIL